MANYLLSALIPFAVCVIYVLELVGFGLLGLYFDRQYRRAFAALRRWPSASAQLTAASLAAARPWLPRRPWRRTRTITLAVTYTYRVGGTDYVGHGVTLNQPLGLAASQAFIQQHPPGSAISVFYDPADPRYAYLDRDTPPSPLWRLGAWLSLALSLPGVCGLVLIPTVVFSNLARSSAAGSATAPAGPQVSSLAFRADGQVLAGGGCAQLKPASIACQRGGLFLWDVSQPARARGLGALLAGWPDDVRSVAYSPAADTLAAVSADGTLLLLDVSQPAAPRGLGPALAAGGLAQVAAFSPDGHTLAVGEYQNAVELWDVTRPAAPRALGQPLSVLAGPVGSLAFSPNGRLLVVQTFCLSASAGACRPGLTVWDVSNSSAPRALAAPFGPSSLVFAALAFSPDSHHLAARTGDGSVGLWDLSDPAAPRSLSILPSASRVIYGLAFGAAGQVLAVSQGAAVELWDVSNPAAPRQVGQVAPAGGVTGVAFSPRGPTLAAISQGDIELWDVTDPAAPRPLGPPLSPAAAAPR